jgi:hypothetical protein
MSECVANSTTLHHKEQLRKTAQSIIKSTPPPMMRIYIPLISALFVRVSVCNFSSLAHVIFQVLNMQQNNAS